jgi:hypothetical protein
VHPTVVADAGGLLVLAGLLEGIPHAVDEIVVLDATSLLLAEYLALRHEAALERVAVEFALAVGVVSEWFPVRGVAVTAALSTAGSSDHDIDAAAALALAESLHVPLVTKNRELGSRHIPVLHC